MSGKIVVLSGMPASGKRSVTEKLHELNPKYTLFKMHCISGEGPNQDCHDLTLSEFIDKVKNGDFLQYNESHGKIYGIDKDELMELLVQDLIPVIQIGRIKNFYELVQNLIGIDVEIVHVQLWDYRGKLAERIVNNYGDRAGDKVSVMMEEFEDAIELMEGGEKTFSLIIRNDSVERTCNRIINFVEGMPSDCDGYSEFYDYLKEIKG